MEQVALIFQFHLLDSLARLLLEEPCEESYELSIQFYGFLEMIAKELGSTVVLSIPFYGFP